MGESIWETIEQEGAMSPLTAWENFYIIVGSSAGALTGLLFVAVTLVAQVQIRIGDDRGIRAFSTPSLVQFGVVLFISAMLSAPWPSLVPPALVLGLVGLAGVIYTLNVMRLLRGVGSYEPVVEDWIWYAACPLVAYAALLAAALLLPGSPVPALFAIAAVMAGLLFLGIRNAWDIVTYLAVEFVVRQDERKESEERKEGKK